MGNSRNRQLAPQVFRINASLYLVRRPVVYTQDKVWREYPMLMLETPPDRSIHIDTERDMAVTEALIAAGLIRLPWLDKVN